MTTTAQANSLMEITQRPDFTIVEGSGSWLIDDSGKRYLDFVQGWAVNCLGHSPKVIVDALSEQSSKLINCSPAFYNEPMMRLAEKIARASRLDRVFFTNSGAEANEGAIKLARKWGQKHKDGAFEIVTMEHSFHGRTLATMSASGKPQWAQLFEPKVPGFTKVAYNNIGALQSALSERTIAVMLEPIQGEAGVIPAADDYLRAVRQLTRDRGILLILDEIQTGMGRTGTLFDFEHCGMIPDILTLGKGLGGGVPLSALVAHQDVCCFDHGDQGGTFNGSALITAVGCAVFDTVSQRQFLENVVKTGAYLKSKLEELSQKHALGDVRGRGLLLALDLKQDIAAQVVKRAQESGLLLNAPNASTLRFMPSLTVTLAEIDQMIDTLSQALS